MSTAIKIENVSKLYRLGTVSTGTIAHDLNRWWHLVRGKDDPYAQVGQVNDRTKSSTKNNEQSTKNSAAPDYVWALRHINLEIKQGEILGIIGRNGAGKSTVLKLLSRVTAPTSGYIKTKGRIASLLEVGTGFHGELTGRENIYLNGSILGMRKHEITKRLDEIVDFSGCAMYIDTPVKRYSSGMTVRLGFAVAASLRCETMIIDEVLAVGDVEFQKACVNKMKDVSRADGKTILFVSHNMSTIAALCKKAVLMQNGKIGCIGDAKDIVSDYISLNSAKTTGEVFWADCEAPGSNDIAYLKSVRITSEGEPTADARLDRPLAIEADFVVTRQFEKINVSFHLNDKQGVCIFATANLPSAMLNPESNANAPLRSGWYRVQCHIPANFLNADTYFVSAFIMKDAIAVIGEATNCLSFTMHDTGEMRNEYLGTWIGMIRPKFKWSHESLESVTV